MQVAVPEASITEDAAGHTSSQTDQGSQTTYACKDLLAAKITNIILRKSAHRSREPDSSRFCFETLSQDEKKFYFYTGLTVQQFAHLFSCLGDDVSNLTFWRGARTKVKVQKRDSHKMKLSPKDQLLLTLVKLRQAFPNRDLAYRFQIGVGTVSVIFLTWVQFLYKVTEDLRNRCFASKELVKEHLPASFRSFKNVRVIIDCFEVFAQQSRDFTEQGHMYSSYKNHATMKGCVGIAPTGGITYCSDMYEGSISDKEIIKKCGFLDKLNPGDLVIADRGFDIKDLLQTRKVHLNIPPFLMNRVRLTAQEEILTKRIARVRIHVERAIERMKKFKIIGRTLPLCLKPVVSQIVHVITFLVNYQEPLVK